MTSPCTRKGCLGTVDETGYCDVCGHAPLAAPAPAADAGSPPPAEGSRSVRPDLWSVAGVDLPMLSLGTAEVRPSASLEPPERSRKCHRCGHDLGRSHAGQPGLSRGFCPRCQTPFSFVPGLREGELVGDRYEVVGCLARGGQGWIYRAKDTQLDDHDVVLKGLINTADQYALALAVAERRFLTETNHPNIVRIFGFVTDRDPLSDGQTGYLVMEYLRGVSLREVKKAAADPNRPAVTLPVEHILAYGHEILAALDHLHGRGLLYCDLKPDNVIWTGDGIKLIDLGGVRRADDRDSPLVVTRDYLVGEEELDLHWLTVRSDLYALGVTLDDLFSVAEPGPAGERSVGVTSFVRLVERARHPRWSRRFTSAAEMSAQLTGVLREMVPPRPGVHRADPSTLFTPSAVLLDAGLGAVPPLAAWTAGSGGELVDDGCPSPAAVAAGLPAPSPVAEEDDDPAVGYLRTVGTPDARSLLAMLATFSAESIEIDLCRCRAHLELAELEDARQHLDAAVGRLGAGAPDDWRVAWHRGLLALAGGDVKVAYERFDEVYGYLPGEIVPKLALGYCAERLGVPDEAVRYYEVVWGRDPLQASAAFGLARIRLAQGDRAAAVRHLDGVPRISQHYDAARTAAVRILAAPLPGGHAVPDDLNKAVRRLPELRLDGGDPHGESRARLTAALREVALELVRTGGAGLAAGEVLGSPPTERGLRGLLEASFRSLARQAATADDHGTLIDRANEVRPRTLLRLR